MKRLVFLCVVLSSFYSFAQRLPELARPVNYKLTFAPDFEKNTFSGQETIAVQVMKSTTKIVLNSDQIDFISTTITSDGATQRAAVTLDQERQMATLAVSTAISAGQATIRIQFNGRLNDELRGFYLGKDAQGRKYAVTQFEATDARRGFPSFDEPAYKATFDVTVIADKKHVALSNAKALSDRPGPGEGKHTITFATSPKMSSYLVAIAVGEFESIAGEVDGIQIRVWGPPGTKTLAPFALESAKACVQYYDRYFGIKYPFQKLDLIGLPDFAAGAMENTGLITFREALLLIDEKNSAISLKREVADTISHEIAHMWFGDLVTMQWWDDVWLNEGFATWMSPKPVAAWKPEWHVELETVRDTIRSLDIDSLQHTRPIHQAAETPDQIQELFDGIAYGKTAAVLRMVEAYLGPDAFRNGVRQYIKEHMYANATATDFWNTLARASGKPADRIMSAFVRQPGMPLVALEARCVGTKSEVGLRQQRYVFDRALFNRDEFNQVWPVPVCIKSDGAATCRLLTDKDSRVELPECGNWVLSNAGAEGFYRSGYDVADVHSLASVIGEQLTPAERIMLLGDVWAGVRVGRQSVTDYLALAEGLQNETSGPVMGQMLAQVDYIGEYLTSNGDLPRYQAWVRKLLAPSIHRLGFDPKPGDSEEDKELRTSVLHVAGKTGNDPEVLAWARKWADRALASDSAPDNTMADVVLPLAALDGDTALYDRIVEKQKHAKTPEEFYVYLDALSAFRDPALIQRSLDRALSPNVRSQDAVGVISRIMEEPAGSRAGWEFAKNHWGEIEKIVGGFAGAGLVEATARFCSSEQRDQVHDFFAAHKVASAERSLLQSLERISNCTDLKEQQSPQLAQWLNDQEPRMGQ